MSPSRAQVSVAIGVARSERSRERQRAKPATASPTPSRSSAMCPMPAHAASALPAPTRSESCFPTFTASSFRRSCAAWTARRAARGYLLLLSNMHAGSEQARGALRAMRGRVDGLARHGAASRPKRARHGPPDGAPALLINTRGDDRRASEIHLDNARRRPRPWSTILRRSAARGWSTSPGRPDNFDAQRALARLPSTRRRAHGAGVRDHRGRLRGGIGSGGDRRAARSGAPRSTASLQRTTMMAIGALQALARRRLGASPTMSRSPASTTFRWRGHLGLTTVRVRIAELGERALERLLAHARQDGVGRATNSTPRSLSSARRRPGAADDRSPTAARFSAGSSLPAALPACAASGGLLARTRRFPRFYEEIERRTFRWFWDTVNRKNGLVPDRWPTPSFSSIAAVGFALRRLCRSGSSAAGARGPKRAT